MRMRGWLRQVAVAVAIQIVVGVPWVLLAQSWTTPITWTAGQLVNETNLNQQIRDNTTYLFNQLGATVPSGAILLRDASTATGCWTGWSEKTAARGYALVGLPNSGTTGGTVGTAFTNLQDKTHTHSVPGLSVPGLSISSAGSGARVSGVATGSLSIGSDWNAWDINSYGTVIDSHNHGGSTGTGTTGTGTSGTAATSSVLAYIQYLVCQKN